MVDDILFYFLVIIRQIEKFLGCTELPEKVLLKVVYVDIQLEDNFKVFRVKNISVPI